MKKVNFFLIFLLLALFSCQESDPKINIESFYFPISDLLEGRVYEYRAINNESLPVEYWYYKSIETDSAIYLTGNYYDHRFEVRQFFTEEIVSNGTLMQDYLLYLPDTTGKTMTLSADILAGNGFPFEVRDSNGIFLFKLMWTFQEQPLITTTLVRNRRYKGDTTYTYMGKNHPCVKFDLVELLDDYNEGHLERKYTGTEIYAKDIGLVYYKKNIDDGFVLEYQLVDVYSIEELESRFKSSLESQ